MPVPRAVKWLALVGLAVVPALPVSAASADTDVRADSHYDSPVPEIVIRTCPPQKGAISSFAVNGQTSHGLVAGDTITGAGRHWACVYQMRDDTLAYLGEEVLTGSVTGCGSGSFTYKFSGSISAADPVTGIRENDGTWSVIAGDGTSALARLKGGGRIRSSVTAALTETGELSGHLSCSG